MIKLSIPHLAGKEQTYVDQAVQSTWITPLGPWVDRFEGELEKRVGRPVVALSSGTAAIHLGLVLAGVERGDEVVCQSLTFAASCNPIVYCGARPVLVDSEETTWNLSPKRLEEAIIDRQRATGRLPKAIVAVDLYGMPAKWDEVRAVAERFGIPVVEDSAEAMGSEYGGRPCGDFGRFGTFSFNGNKIITTSGGGALVCPDRQAAERAKFLSTQAREDRPYYYHTTLGFNYRLSNVSAAIGCAQIEELDQRLHRRRRNHRLYAEALDGWSGIEVHKNPSQEYNSNFWLTTLLLPPGVDPDGVRQAMLKRDIETRLIWRPMHMQPFYEDCPMYGGEAAEGIFARGLCLPSGSNLTDDDVAAVVRALKEEIDVCYRP